MFFLGVIVFGGSLALAWVDEIKFHRPRARVGTLTALEARQHVFDSLALGICVIFVYFVEYSASRRLIYVLLALATALAVTRDELNHHHGCSRAELWLHSLRYLYYPLLLTFLGILWPFIDGVNFLLKIVLPFSVKMLRPLCLGYLSAIALLIAYQSWFWWRLTHPPLPRSKASPEGGKAG
ncbi:MAG: hypothetical protein AB7P04_13050 [Bacteriovoracia bacterium]